jgi:phosphoribosyl-AMP cyclohydrolase
MTKHLKLKCEVVVFVKERVFVKLEPSTKDASSLRISSERTSLHERTKLKEQVFVEGRTSRNCINVLDVRLITCDDLSLSSLAADKTNITCTKVDVKCSYQISLIQIMISNLDPF